MVHAAPPGVSPDHLLDTVPRVISSVPLGSSRQRKPAGRDRFAEPVVAANLLAHRGVVMRHDVLWDDTAAADCVTPVRTARAGSRRAANMYVTSARIAVGASPQAQVIWWQRYGSALVA